MSEYGDPGDCVNCSVEIKNEPKKPHIPTHAELLIECDYKPIPGALNLLTGQIEPRRRIPQHAALDVEFEKGLK